LSNIANHLTAVIATRNHVSVFIGFLRFALFSTFWCSDFSRRIQNFRKCHLPHDSSRVEVHVPIFLWSLW
jgi:hypothetical protein